MYVILTLFIVILIVLFYWAVVYNIREGLNKPLASSAKYTALAKTRGPTAVSFGIETPGDVVATNDGYTNRVVELQKMIDVLSNPNKTQTEKVKYLLSHDTPFKLRNDPELRGPINALQACIKNYIQQLITVNTQVRGQRPIPLTKFDQKNVCKGDTCVRYNNADVTAKYLDDNSGDFIKQMTYLLAPDFVLRNDPDYANLLSTLKRGCIDTNLQAILKFTKKVYQSWIENDSANLQIIQCKGTAMFTAECAEHAKKNAVKDPADVAMNIRNGRKPVARTATGKPSTLQSNPAVRGLL